MKKFYLKFFIKKPYFYFGYILIGLGLISVLMISTKVPIISTHSVELLKNDGYVLSSDEPIFTTDIRTIFIYSNKNNNIYQINNYNIICETEIAVMEDLSNLISSSGLAEDYYIDVSKDTINLLHAIFVLGGNN